MIKIKYPICDNETQVDICLICGCDLENIQKLSQNKINKNTRQIIILKKQFDKLKYNNILDNKDIYEIEK